MGIWRNPIGLYISIYLGNIIWTLQDMTSCHALIPFWVLALLVVGLEKASSIRVSSHTLCQAVTTDTVYEENDKIRMDGPFLRQGWTQTSYHVRVGDVNFWGLRYTHGWVRPSHRIACWKDCEEKRKTTLKWPHSGARRVPTSHPKRGQCNGVGTSGAKAN